MDRILKKLSEQKVTFEDLFYFMQKAAVIGTWEVHMEPHKVYWSEVTKLIHEVDIDYTPNLKDGISFYKKGESRETISFLFDRAVKYGEEYDTELQITSAKGNEKWVRAIGYPIMKDGKCINVIGLFQDITEKTIQANKIALQEEQFRATFDLAATGMALVSLDGILIKVNKTLAKTLGYKQKELVGLRREQIVQKDDLKIGLSAMQELLDEKLDVFQHEIRYIKKNGTLVWCHANITLIKNDKGEPIHFLAHINDITKKRQAQKRINKLLRTTERQNKRLLNFAHIVSHNLRSHSGNISLLLDLMKEEYSEITENEYYPLLQVAAKNLNETISNLNEITLFTKKIDKSYLKINVKNSVDETINCLKAKILTTNSTVNNKIDSNDEIKVVPAYFDSIILNLISNAIKYRKQDIDTIIDITSEKKKKYYVIHIKDNGMGIDLNLHKHKIFGLYNTFHEHKESKGLGLFLSKNQIEAMNGKITVKSKVNIGSTFSIYFKL